MVPMKALKAFESMDGEFQKDDTFVVNEERARILERTDRAVRTTEAMATPAASPEALGTTDDSSEALPAVGLGVPRPAIERTAAE